ncbi:AMP-binding protein [Lysobacter terrestris]|uniref:AMP-binding protein n=2 Tax=Agrilutibacter terrestris TaxID=2865112 RepID=A0A7H0G1M7_9GAMM|nr:AMP-binding protein [Lysobacter terrestris]
MATPSSAHASTGQEQHTPLACFLQRERAHPDAVYLTQPYPDGAVVDYSWAEVGDQARRIAAYLQSLRLQAGSRIALLGRNSAHWIMADLAIMMAGHVSVPLYATQSAQAVRQILQHSGAQALFIGKLDGSADNWPAIAPELPEGLQLIGLPLSPRRDIPQWQDLITRHAPLLQVHEPRPGELCTIMYTSGSTGVPKGVMHSHGGVMAMVPAAEDALGMGASDRMVSYLPLAHVAEREVVEMCSLYFGFRVYFCNSVASFVADLHRARPTIFFSVPRLWIKFQQAVNEKLPPAKQRLLFALPLLSRLVKRRIVRGLGLDHARIAVTGSAPLPPAVVDWYRGLGLEMLEGYGMTEASITHVTRVGQFRSGYVGAPLRGVETRIAADGEIQIRTPGLMLGYYRQPEESAQCVLPDGYYRTGDCGEIDAQGRLRLVGRIKEQFKTSRGEYVVPAPIELLLGDDPRVEAVCVSGSGLPQPFALLMLAEETRHALQRDPALRKSMAHEFTALMARVNARLASYSRLACLVVVAEPWSVDNGLLTPTLKIRRAAIDARYLPQAEAWLAAGEPVVWEDAMAADATPAGTALARA